MSISVEDITRQLTTTVYTASQLDQLRSAMAYAARRAGQEVKMSIAVGNRARFKNRNGLVIEGQVTKVARKYANVRVVDPFNSNRATNWKVPMSMLTVV